MNYEDYKVEELEDESVKKSNIAKTAGIAAGMGIIGAGAAVAATTLTDDDEEVPVVEETDITSDDLVGGASQGACRPQNRALRHGVLPPLRRQARAGRGKMPLLRDAPVLSRGSIAALRETQNAAVPAPGRQRFMTIRADKQIGV